MTFLNFMNSGVGRGARIVAGLGLVGAGLVLGGGWLSLSIIGLVPFAAGTFGLCLVAPLLHQPMRGSGSPGA